MICMSCSQIFGCNCREVKIDPITLLEKQKKELENKITKLQAENIKLRLEVSRLKPDSTYCNHKHLVRKKGNLVCLNCGKRYY